MKTAGIPIDQTRIADFCRKWRIIELSLFGSVLKENFGPESDIDVLVSFEEGAPWSLFHLAQMQQELQILFGREVDMVEKKGLRNPFRRREILGTRQLLYAA